MFFLDALVRFSSPSVTADFGGAARLRCRADKPVEIYHKGTMLVAGGNYALQRRPNTDLTLTINKVSLEDIGKYTCKSDTESSDAQLQIRRKFINLHSSLMIPSLLKSYFQSGITRVILS